MGLEQTQEGIKDRSDVPGCGSSSSSGLHASPGAGWGSRQGNTLAGPLQALGQGHQCVQENGFVGKVRPRRGSQNAPQHRDWRRIVPVLLVITAFGRKPMEKAP